MVGKKIRELRQLKGISLSELSKSVGISKGYLSDLENGIKINPSMDILEKISSSLSINICDIFDNDISFDNLKLPSDATMLLSKFMKLNNDDRKKVLKIVEIFYKYD